MARPPDRLVRPPVRRIARALARWLGVPAAVAAAYLEAGTRSMTRPAWRGPGVAAGLLVLAGLGAVTLAPGPAGAPLPTGTAVPSVEQSPLQAAASQGGAGTRSGPEDQASGWSSAASDPEPLGDYRPVPSPTVPAPSIVRFRPLDGASGVSRTADVSVRFTSAMDRLATEPAFSARIDGASLAGATRWAEGDTVLVLDPAEPFPYGAEVELAVSAGARSAAGVPIAEPGLVHFRVLARPSATPAPTASPNEWQWPLIGPITQRFGESLTQYGYHQGIDIDGETGDPVVAARSGKVIVAGNYDDCGGLEVHIDHGDIVSWYRHLSRIDVVTGAAVAAGARIGLVGNTGCSLGSHLHFAIRVGSEFVDPLAYLPPR